MDRERTIERVRLDAAAREAARHRGVARSGFDPDPIPTRAEEGLAMAARARMAAAHAWAASPQGAYLSAVAAAQKTLADAHATADRARAAAARGLAGERRLCEQALSELRSQAHALSRSLREARRALAGPG